MDLINRNMETITEATELYSFAGIYNSPDETERFIEEYYTLKEFGYVLVECDLFWNVRKLPNYGVFNEMPCWLAFAPAGEKNASKLFGLFNYALGYAGTGPSYLDKLLKKLGVKFDEDLILTKSAMNAYTECIHLHAVKAPDGSLTLESI